MTIPPNTILYMLSQKGCVACAMTRPAFEQIRRKFHGQLLMLEMDIDRVDEIDDWMPKATPAFALKVNGIIMAVNEASMSAAQLEAFIARGIAGKALDGPAKKRKKPKKVAAPEEAPDDEEDEIEDDNEEEEDGQEVRQ